LPIKNFPKKLISRHNDQPKTITKREYKGKIYHIYVKNILVGSETS